MPPIDPFAAGVSGGGPGLGNATGSVVLDTSDLLRAEQVSKTVGQNIERNLGGVGRAADGVQTSIRGIGNEANIVGRTLGNIGTSLQRGLGGVQSTIRSLRTELAGLGVAAGLGTAFGLGAAGDIRTARIRLSQFVQTEEEAVSLMDNLADSANEFGLNIDQVLTFSSTLLPILDEGVDALDDWVVRAARLRSVMPQAIRGSEIRALSEYISGQAVSLQRLFNIPQSVIQDAKDQFDDIGDQIDYILERMGATEQAARDLADPMVGVKNELKLIAAEGFTPILLQLREILPEVREFLTRLRETRPEILSLGAAALAAVAVGAPLLLFLGQVLDTLQKIKAVGLVGSFGKAGLLGAAVVGAGFGVTKGVQAIAQASGPDDPLGDLKHLETTNFFRIMGEGIKALIDVILSAVSFLQEGFNLVIGAMTSFAKKVNEIIIFLGALLSRVGQLLPDELGGRELTDVGGALQNAGDRANEFADRLNQSGENALRVSAETVAGIRARLHGATDSVVGFLERFFGGGGAGETTAAGGALADGGTAGFEFSDLQSAQIAAWQEYQAAVASVEQRGQADRLRLINEGASQRLALISKFERQQTEEQADFIRHRARAIKQLQNDIDKIRGEALSQEAEWWHELQESIGNIRGEGNKRIAEIEEQANRDRLRMAEQHRFNLIEAASRLDARAVASEQRRFGLQSSQFEQQLKVRVQQERDNIDERIEAEEEGHRKRVLAQRAADEKRIEDMQAAQEERFKIDDEERAIRLQRTEQAHKDQLAELNKANRERLREQKDQQRREINELRNQFIQRNLELTDFYDAWKRTQFNEQAASLAQWSGFWAEWIRIQGLGTAGAGGAADGTTGTGGVTGGTGAGTEARPTRDELLQMVKELSLAAGYSVQLVKNTLKEMENWSAQKIAFLIERAFNIDVPGYAMGTMRVPKTGLATVHEGEAVLDRATAGAFRQMLSFASAPASSYSYTGGSSKSVRTGDIKIYQQPGQSGSDVAREVLTILEGM